MGKSTAARLMSERGWAVIDTDILAREVVEPGQPALEEIRVQFGAELIDSQGRLRRDELARRVFADEPTRRQLETILHPRIRERWKAHVEGWRQEGRRHAVVVIPLLFETDAASEFTAVVCVGCTATTQRERLRQRGWDDRQIEQRLLAQWPIERKLELAQFVIWTEGTLEAHAAQLGLILGRLG
jgi:dephospho-CoA kinase